MTEPNATQPGIGATAAPKVTRRVVGQYIRDLSFENMIARKGLPDDPEQVISVNVDVDSRRRDGANLYEVVTKLHVTNRSKASGDPLFDLEVEYAGIFEITGMTDEQLRPFLLVECPRITFPYLRSLVANTTQDAGFLPLVLDAIDFDSLYRKGLNRAQAASADEIRPAKLDS